MSLTREEKTSAFKHIISTVFDLGADSPLEKALTAAGLNTPFDLGSPNLTEADIKDIKYPNNAASGELRGKKMIPGHVGML